jgi:hypothetical protein
MISRSEAADCIEHQYGRKWLREVVATAFELEKEFEGVAE